MSRNAVMRVIAALAVAPLFAGLAGCGGDSDKDAEAGNATRSCDGLLKSADANAKLPDDFPKLDDQVLYEPSSQGKTQVVYAHVDESNFVEVRDEIVNKLKSAGYTIDGTDQESVEAEAEFSGPHGGTIKVQPLCKDTVEIRYKLESWGAGAGPASLVRGRGRSVSG